MVLVCFQPPSEDVLDIPAWEMIYGNRTVGDVQVSTCVRVLPVKFEIEPKKTIGKGAHALRSMLSVLEEIPNLTNDMSIFKDEHIEEDAPGDLQNLKSRDDCRICSLHGMQELSQAYRLVVPSSASAVRKTSKDGSGAFASAGRDIISLTDLNSKLEFHKADRAKPLK